MKRIIIALLISTVVSATPSYSNEISDSFSDLRMISLDNTDVGPIRLYFKNDLSTVLNEKEKDEGSHILTIRAINTKLINSSKDIYLIKYDEGPSVDPTFEVFSRSENRPLLTVNATTLIVPGNGYIYSAGHTNNMFDQRRKYKITKDGFREVRQPYYYVGKETVANKNINLFSSRNGKGELVATVPKGGKIVVLINIDNDYLVKTPFGLVGWLNLKEEEIGNRSEEGILSGIYYNGD